MDSCFRRNDGTLDCVVGKKRVEDFLKGVFSKELADLKKEIHELRAENEQLRKFIEIGNTISVERNIDRLIPLIMSNISEAVHADRSSLFLVDWERMELWTKFAEDLEVERISIGLKMGLVGLSVLTRQLVNVANAYEDVHFNPEIDKTTDFRTESVLCAPLFDEQRGVMGAVQLLNKKTGCFTKEDEQKVLKAAPMLAKTACATDLDIDRFKALVYELRKSTECERGSLFLLDKEKGDLCSVVTEGLDDQDIHLSVNLGIAGLVATTCQDLNIPDAYADPRFDKSTDEKTGYRTRCILCVPIKNQSGEVLGVIQVLNKKEGTFTGCDVDLLKALSSIVAISVESAMLFDEQQRQFRSVLEVLAASIDAKDPLTAGHSQKVTEYAAAIARELGFGEVEIDVLSVAALLHDYGKLGIDDNILKKPGKLTPEEYEHIKQHVANTGHILNKMCFMRKYRDVPLIASCHHERMDGSGYTDGLKAHEIPFMAKILAVADVFEALTARRHYREALSPQDAFEILEQGAGTKFDENVVTGLKRYWHNEKSKFDR